MICLHCVLVVAALFAVVGIVLFREYLMCRDEKESDMTEEEAEAFYQVLENKDSD